MDIAKINLVLGETLEVLSEFGGFGRGGGGRGRDPYWMKANQDGVDKKGNKYKKGDEVFYYPNTRTILAGEAAKRASNDFDAAKEDERFITGEDVELDETTWGIAAKLGSVGLGLHLNKNPSGTYSFVGSVPVELSWERLDGKPMSDEEQKELLDMINHNAPYSYLRKSYKKVLFKTPEEGLAAAKKGGYKVSNADEFKAGS